MVSNERLVEILDEIISTDPVESFIEQGVTFGQIAGLASFAIGSYRDIRGEELDPRAAFTAGANFGMQFKDKI